MDSIEEDLKRCRVNNWKTEKANGMEWKIVVGTVKAGTMLQYQYELFTVNHTFTICYMFSPVDQHQACNTGICKIKTKRGYFKNT
jgi:hypothetical protein